MIIFYLSPMAWMPSCDIDLSGLFYICTMSVSDLNFLKIWFTVLDADDQIPLSDI